MLSHFKIKKNGAGQLSMKKQKKTSDENNASKISFSKY